MTSIQTHISQITKLLRGIKLSKQLVIGALFPYYIITVLNSFLESVGMLLMVSVFSAESAIPEKNEFLAHIFEFINAVGGESQFPGILPILITILSLNLITRFGLQSSEWILHSVLRQKIQKMVFKHYLLGDWSHMRDFRLGDATGTNTQEAINSSRYLVSVVQAIYFILSSVVILGVAFLSSSELLIIFILIGLPLIVILKKLVVIQARFSKRATVLRNEFAGDITDRFNGLLQIHVDDNFDFHLQEGLQAQDRLTRLEILSGFCQAATGTLYLLLPIIAFTGFYIWFNFMEVKVVVNLPLIASVGLLGLRAVGLFNGAVAAIGTLSRLSGSIYPVLNAMDIPSIPDRVVIDEKIVRIELEKAGYDFGGNRVFDDISFVVGKGTPLILSGRSGKGKTTLGNIVAGLYFPSNGKLFYVGTSGTKFDSKNYRAKVGFVTQDIYLFKGSLRSNLIAGRDLTDQQIWTALEQVDAAKFVKSMGGLDTEAAEAGRSLSGGQRRRLGIARVLLSGKDVLIFDEVTAGLDKINKGAVLNVIEKLSKLFIVVVISHEELSFSSQEKYSI